MNESTNAMGKQPADLQVVPVTPRDELIASGEDPRVVDAAIAAMQALAELEWRVFNQSNHQTP